MSSPDFFTSVCRHCRHYCPEGRRGGHCSQLNVSVQGSWKSCPLAVPVFQPSWEFQPIPIWQNEESEFIKPLSSASQNAEVRVSSL